MTNSCSGIGKKQPATPVVGRKVLVAGGCPRMDQAPDDQSLFVLRIPCADGQQPGMPLCWEVIFNVDWRDGYESKPSAIASDAHASRCPALGDRNGSSKSFLLYSTLINAKAEETKWWRKIASPPSYRI